MEEKMKYKSYKDVERSHSGFTNDPYVPTLAQLFATPMFTWFHVLFFCKYNLSIPFNNVGKNTISHYLKKLSTIFGVKLQDSLF